MSESSIETREEESISLLKENNIQENIVEAFQSVDQAIFFDSIFKDKFYTRERIQIGAGQKNDDFLNLAKMINYLDPRPTHKVLEIGTGSGYSSSILSMLCRELLTVEIKEDLAKNAKTKLYNYEFENIRFFAGDACELDVEEGSIDAIIVHAACKKRPLNLIKSLVHGGKMVFPMGPAHSQQIVLLENTPNYKQDEPYCIKYFDFVGYESIAGRYGYEAPDYSMMGEEVYLKPEFQERSDMLNREAEAKKMAANKKTIKSKIKNKLFGSN
jgi:protein-L-isoaspartate(D-aspartate) O-methyltransferase